jgi:hypothetical protein
LEGNCFPEVADADALDRVAVCERWLYSTCLVFALPLAEQEKTRFRYSYSWYEGEYSRNYLFRDWRFEGGHQFHGPNLVAPVAEAVDSGFAGKPMSVY